MNKETHRLYKAFRLNSPFMLVGENAQLALSSAKTLIEFRELEADGKVRIEAQPEEENYFDVYGEPEGYTNRQGKWISPEQERKELIDTLNDKGCYWVQTEYVTSCSCGESEQWEQADSIGMCVYNDPTDPFENCYVIDMMREAVEQYHKANDEN